MRGNVDPKLEAARVRGGFYGSNDKYGLTGAFYLMGPKGAELAIMSSGPDTETGWEHVSVSVKHRTPNWDEMCWVKDLFWGPEECVVQYHPPRSSYVNLHPHCLHLWRPMTGQLPMPPAILVGPQGETTDVEP